MFNKFKRSVLDKSSGQPAAPFYCFTRLIILVECKQVIFHLMTSECHERSLYCYFFLGQVSPGGSQLGWHLRRALRGGHQGCQLPGPPSNAWQERHHGHAGGSFCCLVLYSSRASVSGQEMLAIILKKEVSVRLTSSSLLARTRLF